MPTVPGECPRCGGAVDTRFIPGFDDPKCINCGHRLARVPDSIKNEVRRSEGRPRIYGPHVHGYGGRYGGRK